jgi:hypothetical protein
MLMFKNGDVEMWCDWRIEFDCLVRIAPLVSSDQKVNTVLTLFKGKALQHFKEFTWLVHALDVKQVRKARLPGLWIRSLPRSFIEL